MSELPSQYQSLSLDLRSGSIEDKDRFYSKEEKFADSSKKAVQYIKVISCSLDDVHKLNHPDTNVDSQGLTF